MSLTGVLSRAALGVAICMSLAGCISVFPKTPPAQLYRFGGIEPSATQPAASASVANIARGDINFDSSASTDRILAMTGQDAAYISGARWVAPAPIVFEEALIRGFQATPGAPRLVERGSLLRAPLTLNLDVQAFEARYDQGADKPPLVVIQVHAVMMRSADRSVAGEQTFVLSSRAGDNRVSLIAQAFDEATKSLIGKLADWSGGLATAARGA